MHDMKDNARYSIREMEWSRFKYFCQETRHRNTDQIFSASEASTHQFSDPLVLVELHARWVRNVQIAATAGVNVGLLVFAQTTTSVWCVDI